MWATVEVNRHNVLATGYFGSVVAVLLNDVVLASLSQRQRLLVPVSDGSVAMIETDVVLSYQQRRLERLLLARLPVPLDPSWSPAGCRVVAPVHVFTNVVPYPGPPPYLVQTVEYSYNLMIDVATEAGVLSFTVPAPPGGTGFVVPGLPPVGGEAQVFSTCTGWTRLS